MNNASTIRNTEIYDFRLCARQSKALCRNSPILECDEILIA